MGSRPRRLVTHWGKAGAAVTFSPWQFGLAEGERVTDRRRGWTVTVGLSRHCGQPTPRRGVGRVGGPKTGADRHSCPAPTLRAAKPRSPVAPVQARGGAPAGHAVGISGTGPPAWADRVVGRGRAGREPQAAIRPAPEE